MEKQILRAVEEAYRKGLQDAKGLNDISSFLLTSQIVAHEVANKFCQPLVVGQSEQLCQCEDAPIKHFINNWCDDCQKHIV